MPHGFDWPDEIGHPPPHPTSERERLTLLEELVRAHAMRQQQHAEGMGRAFWRLDQIDWRLHPIEAAIAELRDLPARFLAHEDQDRRRMEDAAAAAARAREAEEARRELRRDALTLAKYIIVLVALLLSAAKTVPPELLKALAPALGLGK